MKEYIMKITTLGPVHIGYGERLTKLDYIYHKKNNTISILNKQKLIKLLKEKNLTDRYVRDCLSKGSQMNIKIFFDKNKISRDDIEMLMDYQLNIFLGKKDFINKSYSFNRDIQLFIRNGREETYIPGSSIKGLLNTVISSYCGEEYYKNISDKIYVSDSEPISSKNLAVFQKNDVNKQLDKLLPIYRECILPNKTFEIKLKIDEQIISIEEIEKAIIEFSNNYRDKWLLGFRNTDGGKEAFKRGAFPNELNEQGSKLIYLGGGVGFVSKTSQYQKYDKTKAREEVFNVLERRHGFHYRKMKHMPSNVPVALKATQDVQKNKVYQMGLCKVEFLRR